MISVVVKTFLHEQDINLDPLALLQASDITTTLITNLTLISVNLKSVNKVNS